MIFTIKGIVRRPSTQSRCFGEWLDTGVASCSEHQKRWIDSRRTLLLVVTYSTRPSEVQYATTISSPYSIILSLLTQL